MAIDRTGHQGGLAAEDQRRELHQRVLRGDSSLIPTNSVGGALDGAAVRDREQKNSSERYLELVQQAIARHLAAIDDAIGDLQRMAAWHREQAELAL